MLAFDAGGLPQHLTPAVLAGRLGPEHRQARVVEPWIAIRVDSGEEKVGLRLPLGSLVEAVTHAVSFEDGAEVVLESEPGSSAPAIVNRLRERQELVDVVEWSHQPLPTIRRSCSRKCASSAAHQVSNVSSGLPGVDRDAVLDEPRESDGAREGETEERDRLFREGRFSDRSRFLGPAQAARTARSSALRRCPGRRQARRS